MLIEPLETIFVYGAYGKGLLFGNCFDSYCDSIAVVFLQGRNQAIKQQITDLNSKISDEKQGLIMLSRRLMSYYSDRIKEIANKAIPIY